MGRLAATILQRILVLAVSGLIINARFIVRWFKFNSISPRNPPEPPPPVPLPFLPTVLLVGGSLAIHSSNNTNTGGNQAKSTTSNTTVCHGNIFQQYEKEWLYLDNPEQFLLAYREYYQACKPKTNTFILDANPHSEYLTQAELVYHIYQKDPNQMEKLKIVFLLQEPIQAYGETMLLPEEQGHYAFYLSQWFQYFDPLQILVLNPQTEPNIQHAIQLFLEDNTPLPLLVDALSTDPLNCSIANALQPMVDSWNGELYELLATIERSPMETNPFPPFTRFVC